MKNVEKSAVQGSITRICHGLANQIGVVAIGSALFVAPFAATVARADSAPVTQFQYLQWVAQLSGASGQFNASSSAADYVHWAQAAGINPAGGWQPGAKLSKNVLAETLSQATGASPNKFHGDYVRVLGQLGIDLSSVKDDVTKDDLVGLTDQNLQPRVFVSNKKNGDPSAPRNPTPRDPNVGKITICQKAHVTITISRNALDAHLAHGDSIGPCVPTQTANP